MKVFSLKCFLLYSLHLLLSKMAVTYAAAHITWWMSPGLLRKFRTASDERTRPGNEAKKRYQALQPSRLWFRWAFSLTWNRAAQILELQPAGGMHIVVWFYLEEPFDFQARSVNNATHIRTCIWMFLLCLLLCSISSLLALLCSLLALLCSIFWLVRNGSILHPGLLFLFWRVWIVGAGSPLFWFDIYLCIYQSLRMLHWRRKQGGREGRRMEGEHNMYIWQYYTARYYVCWSMFCLDIQLQYEQ